MARVTRWSMEKGPTSTPNVLFASTRRHPAPAFAELLLSDGLEPMQLFRMVATPNGTTLAGWAVMEARGVPQAIGDGIVAASKRAAELAEEAGKT